MTAVIPTHNRKQLLRCLLQALSLQTAAQLAEVIVVDDGSSDGTGELLSTLSLSFPLRVVRTEGKGPAAARNEGLAAATADVVLFLDDDVIPGRGLVAAHLSRHRGDANAVVIGRLLPCLPKSRLSGWERWEQTILDRTYDSVLSGRRPVDGDLFYTGNVSVRRSALLAVGGFDVALAFHEDVDLGHRLQAAGARFYFADEATASHCGHHSFEGWQRRHFQFGRYRVARQQRDPADAGSLARMYRGLNPITRLLVRPTAGRARTTQCIAGLLGLVARSLDRVQLWSLSNAAYAALANVRYWSGVADVTGGREGFWGVVRGNRPAQASMA